MNTIIAMFGKKSNQFKEIVPKISDFYKQRSDQENIDYVILNSYIVLIAEQITIQLFEKRTKTLQKKAMFGLSDSRYLIRELLIKDMETNLENIYQFMSSNPYKTISNLIKSNLDQILKLDLTKDVFNKFYLDIVSKDDRQKSGEYYTPNWLVQFIIKELMENQSIKHPVPTVLDPACGSGTFLINFMYYGLNKGYYKTGEDVVDNFAGYDINPVAVFLTRCNYFLFLTKFDLPLLDLEKAMSNIKCSNIFLLKPLSPYKTYDILLGNPPWLTLKSIEDENTQEALKQEIFKYNLVSKKSSHLFTQFEFASVFFCKSVDIFLKKDGFISFVMPKSVLADTRQNEEFKTFSKPPLKVKVVYDLQLIKNLFFMPACIISGQHGGKTDYPVEYKILKGDAVALAKGKGKLEIEISSYEPPSHLLRSTEKSIYFNKFKVGASIFPRNLYFVHLINEKEEDTSSQEKDKLVRVMTDPGIDSLAKKNWRGITLTELVSKKYLFSTLLAWELVPFGYTKLRQIILPIKIDEKRKILLIDDLYRCTTDNSLAWFTKTNQLWTERSTLKSKKRFPLLCDRLNYNYLLTCQQLNKRFLVLYSGTGTNICSSVVDRNNLNAEPTISRLPFIVDVKCWYYETENEKEAHFLCAILNSPHLNTLIKPLQPQGLGGARAIHRRPFQFSIPEFNEKEKYHIQLALISKECHNIIKNLKPKLQPTLRSRKISRSIVEYQIKAIDQIVTKIINIK